LRNECAHGGQILKPKKKSFDRGYGPKTIGGGHRKGKGVKTQWGLTPVWGKNYSWRKGDYR